MENTTVKRFKFLYDNKHEFEVLGSSLKHAIENLRQYRFICVKDSEMAEIVLNRKLDFSKIKVLTSHYETKDTISIKEKTHGSK